MSANKNNATTNKQEEIEPEPESFDEIDKRLEKLLARVNTLETSLNQLHETFQPLNPNANDGADGADGDGEQPADDFDDELVDNFAPTIDNDGHFENAEIEDIDLGNEN